MCESLRLQIGGQGVTCLRVKPSGSGGISKLAPEPVFMDFGFRCNLHNSKVRVTIQGRLGDCGSGSLEPTRE